MMTFVLQDGRRPLYIASLNGHLGVVKTLMEAGANISETNKVGVHYNTFTFKQKDVHALPRDSIYGCVTFLLVQARTRIISGYTTVQGKLPVHVVRILKVLKSRGYMYM